MLFRSRENTKQYLKDNPEVFAEIVEKVREHYGLKEAVSDAVKEPEPSGKAAKNSKSAKGE